MKKLFKFSAALALAAVFASTALYANTYTKADNTNSLDQAVSWGGTAPTATDIASWSGTYSADVTTTNALRAVLPAGTLSWQGISIGTISGNALATNTFTTSTLATPISIFAAYEGTNAASANVSNVVTVMSLTAHGLLAGQPITISGVTPAGYNGNFFVASVPTTTNFTCINAANTGMGPGTAFGTAAGLPGLNLFNATETSLNGFNIVTITTKAAHGYEPGQSVTITGVSPAGYNGTFIVAGVPSGTTFTYTNAIGSLVNATTLGTVSSAIYIGGAGTATATSKLMIGSSGIDLSAANVSAVINVNTNVWNGNQQWKVPAGRVLRFSNGGLSGASTRVDTSGADGIITVSGGGVVSLNEGGGTGFTDANSFAPFAGSWQVDSGTTLRGLRNGASAFGSGSITLNGGTLAVGGMSGDVGNWTWNTTINLNPGTTSYLSEQNVTGGPRYLLLSGAIAGAGNLVFTEPLVGATSFTSQDQGFILSGSESMSGSVTIGGPVENGVPGRLSYVRVGGNATGTATTIGAGSYGSLGSATSIINNGVLSFTQTGGYALPCAISGTGTLRIGSLSATTGTGGMIGDAYQNISLTGVNTYTGPTIINAGTLTLATGAAVANSSSIVITTNSINGGAAINTFDVSGLAGGFTTAAGQTFSDNGGQLIGNFSFVAGSTNILAPGCSNLIDTLSLTGNLNLSGGSNTLVLDINSSANDQLSISGNLTASGVTTLQFVPPGTGLSAGTYTLITAASVTASPANFSIVGLAAGARPQTFSIAVSGNQIQLVVVGSPGNLTWIGDGTNNKWDTQASSNWWNTANVVKDVFVAGDIVTFDDSGSNSPAINLISAVRPGGITNSSSINYTFAGAGQIVGAGGLTKTGSGILTVNNSNLFTGPVQILGGVLAITNEFALGAPTNPTVGGLVLDNGGALLITNTIALGANTNRGIIIGSGGGMLIISNGATLTVSNTVGDVGGTSVLTKSGNGTLILSGNNNYGNGSSGSLDATIVNGGTVVYGSGAGLSRAGNTSGTSGFFAVPFELDNGVVDLNGKFSYEPNFAGGSAANGTPVVLYNGTVNVNGQAGAPLVFQDTAATPSGWGSAVATSPSLNYSSANNPGTLTISARFACSGSSGVTSRTINVDDSSATATEVNFTAPLGVLSVNSTNQDGRNTTIIKTGAGTMQISAANAFPILQVDAGTLRVNHPLALGADRTISTGVSGGTGSPNQVIVTAGVVDLNGFNPAIGGLSDNATTTGLVLNNGAASSTLTLGASLSNTVFNASYSSVIADGTSVVSLNKIGTNIQTLAGINTYSGLTTVSNGTLLVNAPGQIGLGAATNLVTVAGGALGGSGTVNAPVTVQAGGTLAPGASASVPTTLTINASLTLGGTNVMNVNKDLATNDLVVLTAGTLSYGGVLEISTNQMTSTALVLGDSFKLFSTSAHAGNFSGIAGSPGTGLGWSFNPASGVVTVVNGMASNPTNILVNVTGGTMTLSWPTDHLGWLLQSQTNSLNSGLGANWVDVPGSDAVTSTNLPVVPGNPSVFYRLRHP